MIASFGVGVQLARMLGVAGYGYYGIALAIITLAGIPGEMGISRLATREVAAAAALNDLPRLYGVIRWSDAIVWKVSALLGLLVLVASAVIQLVRPSVLSWAIVLGAPMIPLMALARIRGGALQGLHHIVLGQVPANLVRPMLLSALLFAASVIGLSVDAPAAMALNSAAALIVFAISHLLLTSRLPGPRPAHVTQSGGKWVASSIPMALTDGMRILQSELSVLLLSLVATASQVGLLRIAVVCGTAAATAIPVMNHVAFPVIARLHAEKDHARLQAAVTRLAQAQVAGTLALTLPLLAAAEWLIGLAFGADYVPAANAVRVIAAAQLVNALFGPNAALLNMTHNERRVTRAMAIALAFNVVSVLLLGAAAGTVGAATGFFVSILLWNLLTWHDGRQILGIDTLALRRTGA